MKSAVLFLLAISCVAVHSAPTLDLVKTLPGWLQKKGDYDCYDQQPPKPKPDDDCYDQQTPKPKPDDDCYDQQTPKPKQLKCDCDCCDHQIPKLIESQHDDSCCYGTGPRKLIEFESTQPDYNNDNLRIKRAVGESVRL